MGLEVQPLGFPPRVREPDPSPSNPAATIPTLHRRRPKNWSSTTASPDTLAHKHGSTDLVVSDDDPDWPYYRQFLDMGEATLVPHLTKIVRYKMLEPGEHKLPQAADDDGDDFIERLQFVSERLPGPRLDGRRPLHLADISVGYAVHLGAFFRLSDRMPPQGDRLSGAHPGPPGLPARDGAELIKLSPCRRRWREAPDEGSKKPLGGWLRAWSPDSPRDPSPPASPDPLPQGERVKEISSVEPVVFPNSSAWCPAGRRPAGIRRRYPPSPCPTPPPPTAPRRCTSSSSVAAT